MANPSDNGSGSMLSPTTTRNPGRQTPNTPSTDNPVDDQWQVVVAQRPESDHGPLGDAFDDLEREDIQVLENEYMAYAFLGSKLATAGGNGIDLSRIAPSLSIWVRIGLVVVTIIEASGSFFITLAAQVHVSPTPLALRKANQIGVEVALAVIGGICLGLRRFIRIISAVFNYAKADKSGEWLDFFKHNALERLSGYSWIVAMDFAASDKERIIIITSIILNFIVRNIIAWDMYAAISSIILTAFDLTLTAIAYWRIKAYMNKFAATLDCDMDDIERGSAAIDLPNDLRGLADHKGKLIERKFANRKPWLEFFCMVMAEVTAAVPIAAAIASKHSALSKESFAAYLQANVIAAIVNFVILGCNLIILTDWAANRARLGAINRVGLAEPKAQVAFSSLHGVINVKNTPVRLTEAQIKEAQDMYLDFQNLQATVEDVADDESIERRRRRRLSSWASLYHGRYLEFPYKPLPQEDRINE
ncbi:hypothetical protein TrVGV298_006355 [Trichoderma virens]|nr:hypothetical protein TrVGV298_006355 [Trichoderma virens]